METENFLNECKRYLKFVSIIDEDDDRSTNKQRRLDVGLHGRKASWTLESAADALGSEQPVLVGKYTVLSTFVKKQNREEKEDNEEEEDEEDPNAAPTTSSNQNQDCHHHHLQITLYVTYNQPYNVPALDFIATELETGQPVCDVEELRRDWLPHLLDAVAIDAKTAAEFEERINKSNNNNNHENENGFDYNLSGQGDSSSSSSSQIRNTILTPATVPRISRMIHETLNIPVFSVHACDTVSHFKMMKVQMMLGRSRRRLMMRKTTTEGKKEEEKDDEEEEFSQSPIDVVLALYGRFIGLE